MNHRAPVAEATGGDRLGHDVTGDRRRAVTIMDVEQLGGTMIEQLAGLSEGIERGRTVG